VGLKKKTRVTANSSWTCKDDDVVVKKALVKANPTKKDKKAAVKNGAKSKTKSASGKQRKLALSVTADQNDGGLTDVLEMDPFEVARRKMKGSVPAIVDAMVELAKQGSCSHAKTLLEMTGAKLMFDTEPEKQDSSQPWARLVLEKLSEAESAGEQKTV